MLYQRFVLCYAKYDIDQSCSNGASLNLIIQIKALRQSYQLSSTYFFVYRFFKGCSRGRNLVHSKYGYIIGMISLQLILKTQLVFSMPQISPGKEIILTRLEQKVLQIKTHIFISNTGNAKLIIDPTLDGRKEIANFNLLMDQIFVRMNLAIRVSLRKYLLIWIVKIIPMNKVMWVEFKRFLNFRRKTQIQWI